MRFVFAHKLSTYLMALSAFFALVLSGELGAGVTLLGLIAIGVSWFWEPPRIRFERYATVWTVLTVLYFLYSLLAFLAGADFLILAAEFLVFLTAVKLFTRRACRDYLQVYVLTFLMLVAGTVLNTEFTYGFFFLIYVVSFTWGMILFHLRREMEDNFLLRHSEHRATERVEVARILGSRRIVGGRFFLGTSVVSLAVFFLSVVLFLMIPRIGFGLFFQKNRGGLSMAGFGDGVSLDGHGVIKYDPTVVMRVKVDSAYEGRRAPYLHWRGVAFDYYHNGTWDRTHRAPETNYIAANSDKRRYERYYLRYDAVGAVDRNALAEQLSSRTMHQEIYLEPLGSDVLFAASMPMAFDVESQWTWRHHRRRKWRNDEVRHHHSVGIRYDAYSIIDPPPSDVLRAAPRNFLPDGFGVYLQVPDEITTRVRMKAREITRGATNNYDKAVAIEQWLEDNLSYTLEMASPGDQEPIDFFLFTRRKGHCEYFSSAMVIMARVVGIPARNVNGFLGGEWNEYDDYIAVRAGDAHSWVEVYFPGAGWVTFDPTPSAEIDRLGRGGAGLRARLRRFMDTLRFKWFQWVIEYDLYRQLDFFKKLSSSMRGGGRSLRDKFRAAGSWARGHRTTAAGVVGGAALLLLAILLLRRRRRDAGPGARPTRRRGPVAQIYLTTLRRLRRHGHHKPLARTPREHAATLSRLGTPGAAALTELTEIYYAAEYGERDDPDAHRRANELAEAITQAFRDAKRAR